MNLPDRYDRRAPDRHSAGLAVPYRPIPQPGGDLLSLGAILRRRALMIGCVIGICTILALLITSTLPKRYVAESDVSITVNPVNDLPGESKAGQASASLDQTVETELQIFASRELATAVLEDPTIGGDPGLSAALFAKSGPKQMLRQALGQSDPPTPAPATRAFREAAIDFLQGGLQAFQLGKSAVLRISFTAGDPDLAARAANAFTRAYARDKVTVAATGNEESVQALRTRLAELQEQAQREFAEVQRYRIANNLLSSSATSLTEGEISTYNQQVAGARAQAAEDQARLDAARRQLRGGRGDVGEGTTSGVIQALRAQRATISGQVADLSSRYRPGQPDLVIAQQQLADLDRQIEQEVDRTLKALEARSSSSRQRLGSLQVSQTSARSALAGNNSALVQLDELQRRAEASQALYESYLNRYKEAVARTGSEQSGVRILSPARMPGGPVGPNVPLNLAFGFLFGCMLGVGAAVLSEANFPGFTTPEDVERKLGLAFFGSIPLARAVGSAAISGADAVRIHPGGLMAESVRSIFVRASQVAGRYKVVALASALPGEGKTTQALMLGRVLGPAGHRTLLIDCDVIRRELSQQAGATSDRPGLNEVLKGGATLEEAMIADEVPNLFILPITTGFAEGERLIRRDTFKDLIERCGEAFDIVLLDCAPVLALADSREIIGLADVTLFTVLWRKTKASTVRTALRMIPDHAVPKLGIVLNRVDVRKRRRFGGSDAAFFYQQNRGYYTDGRA